jgi:hypothetical protein
MQDVHPPPMLAYESTLYVALTPPKAGAESVTFPANYLVGVCATLGAFMLLRDATLKYLKSVTAKGGQRAGMHTSYWQYIQSLSNTQRWSTSRQWLPRILNIH